MNADSVSRAGSPLLFGLAPRGVFRAPGVTTVAAALRRHSSAGTSDHPARPPVLLYLQNNEMNGKDFSRAMLVLFQAKQLFELGLGQDRHAEFFRLLELRSRIGPDHHVIRLLAHRP